MPATVVLLRQLSKVMGGTGAVVPWVQSLQASAQPQLEQPLLQPFPQPQEPVQLPQPQPGVLSNYAYFPVVFASRALRDAVCDVLLENGVYARKYFYPLINDFECYQGRPGFDSALTPVARRLADGVVTLPLYPDLAMEDAALIAQVIRGVMGHE